MSKKLEIGKYYPVPCIETYDEFGVLTHITPVIDHPHNDIENGQPEVHYHIDTRFLNRKSRFQDRVVLKSGKHYDAISARPEGIPIIYVLKLHSLDFAFTTAVKFIRKSKLKHKCIYKGKCPHRGYDLSNEEPVDGIITCPLHGLKFDAITKQLLNDPAHENL